MESKAILFGINYKGSKYPLRGCITDVQNMSRFVKDELDYGTVKVYTDETTPSKVTGQGIVRLLCKLAMESRTFNLVNLL